MINKLQQYYLHEMGIEVYELRKKPHTMAKLKNLATKSQKYNFPIPNECVNNFIIITEQLSPNSSANYLLQNIFTYINVSQATPLVIYASNIADDDYLKLLQEYVEIINPKMIIFFKLTEDNFLETKYFKNHHVRQYNLLSALNNSKLKKEIYLNILQFL